MATRKTKKQQDVEVEAVEAPAEEKLHMQVSCVGYPSLNVRADAGLGADIVGTLENGAEFDVLEEKHGWYRTANGWVMARFCEPA